jgi:hypothetical protein
VCGAPWHSSLHGSAAQVYTIPRFDELVLRSIKAKGGDPVSVGGLYAVLVISAWLHNVTFFFLIARVGAVRHGLSTHPRLHGDPRARRVGPDLASELCSYPEDASERCRCLSGCSPRCARSVCLSPLTGSSVTITPRNA